MLETIYSTPDLDDRYDAPAHANTIIYMPRFRALQRNELEGRLRLARTRLLRLVRMLGVPADTADDVVQDILLAAWRGSDQLLQPGRFDAWLTAIARNHVRMYLRSHRGRVLELAGRSTLEPKERPDEREAEDVDTVPDPLALDPLDALDQRDLESLLDRALGHLSAPARTALILRYVIDLPESEAAAMLGVSIPTLEARLHRARKQVRNVLAGPLRSEAEAFGLRLDAAPPAGWQETRLWCNICGRRRLLGTFERQPSGHRHMRLRCPDCSERFDVDIYGNKGIVPLDDLRSFRPALTRTMRALSEHYLRALESGDGVCMYCGAPARLYILGPGDLQLARKLQQHLVVTECQNPACMANRPCTFDSDKVAVHTAVEPAIWLHPQAQRFMAEHPRWITQPETTVEFEGQQVIRFALADAVSAARLTALADPHTLRILAVFPT